MSLSRRHFLGTSAAAATLAALATPGLAQGRTFFGIATGGTGGTYYPLGGMLAQLISNTAELPDTRLSATAETGNASVANAQLLGRGEIESAFASADILDAAYNGTGQFEGEPIENLRAIGALYPETVQLVVRAESGITSIEDLRGKSVSSGSPGSGQWQLLGDLLEAHGMTREDINEDYSSFAQSVDKIKDGNLDASLITAGLPTSSVTDLANGHEIAIVPLVGPAIEAMQEAQPYYASAVIPAGAYNGIEEDVPTLAVRAIWTTHAEVSEDVVYAVTKALYENTETLGQVHPMGKQISVETALESVSIPLHPGAERYYKEMGVTE
ncbi:ABC transporter, phosphonate, periplasmic substrate-binding protein [Pseudooceanicola marinus]|uniref:ABC transporter, phosphonate, periplasmic substrate-binding protein n=1 Tax=Pseudooceanicola marinus TaxID=396013 RepID=A0A1X6Y897_9RHOB|nr:TAXI family TRAP transporter solute-binding subunit [Pseudooceanicola marinus]PJE33293.1 immunogenic protein [Pseudooceanicola marinus]SLN11840.1 ABC transporter, phosphonate, periplasmic substrate-binding protein [Pseudooceanicola marinus]